MLSSSQLAEHLKLSKGRVSQLVGDGTLAGCYEGSGRQRRFDVPKVLAALNRGLDPAQMLGNGAKTKRVIRALQAGQAVAEPQDDDQDAAPVARRPASLLDGAALPQKDPDRYEMARAARAEEDLRTARLRNGREEGQYVLAVEVARDVSQAIGQEVREVETFLRDVARVLADKMQVDFKVARQILMEGWRDHRKGRAEILAGTAAATDLTEAEQQENI